ncbi:MAG: winged helix-turn-helix transcriptional regulator [Methanosarcinales archaeon]|nr:winged helix-turn-helix transcriptional regulator [Methanosarcinales archaeon]
MENTSESSLNELVKWVISVDRRLVLMETMKGHTVARASDIAHETSRSTQNISRALRELEDKELIDCLTPEKTTWKKYVLTDRGKEILDILEEKYL